MSKHPGRRKPNVLCSHIDKKTCKQTEILEADGVYVVLRNRLPFNLRTKVCGADKPPHYWPFSFANKASAFNLAEKLNKLFNTDEFAVHEVAYYTPIEEELKP